MFLAFVISLAFAIGIWLLFDRDGSRKTIGRLYAKYAGWMEARPDRYSSRQVERWRHMAWAASKPNSLRLKVSRAAGSASVTTAIVLIVAYMAGAIEA